VLYKPHLLLEAPADAVFAWFPLEQPLTAGTAVEESAELEEDVLPADWKKMSFQRKRLSRLIPT
jgi:hypothetical protein